MTDALDLPSDLAAAHAMIRAEREARLAVEKVQATERLLIEKLRQEIARLRRQAFGSSSEKSRKLEQLELMLEDAEETWAEARVAAEVALVAVTSTPGVQRERRSPMRGPLPDHLPRKRIVVPGPATCSCCGGDRLVKLGEDVTETLERIPACWFVIQHVREKFSCRACETIVQAPAPFHPIARGRAGVNLLAEIVTAKFGMHLPLHRQGERFAREGVPITDSTLAPGSPTFSPGCPGIQLAPSTTCCPGTGTPHDRSRERLTSAHAMRQSVALAGCSDVRCQRSGRTSASAARKRAACACYRAQVEAGPSGRR